MLRFFAVRLTHWRPALRSAFVAVLVMSFSWQSSASQSQAQGRWYDAYQEGVRAVQKRDWAAAEKLLLQAQSSGPRPARRVFTFGDTYIPFIPDYYLGVVYLNTNRDQQAEAAFARVNSQTLIGAKDPEYVAFERQGREATFNRAFGEAQQLVAKGDFVQANSRLEQARTTRIDDAKVKALSGEIVQQMAKADSADKGSRPSPDPADAFTCSDPATDHNGRRHPEYLRRRAERGDTQSRRHSAPTKQYLAAEGERHIQAAVEQQQDRRQPGRDRQSTNGVAERSPGILLRRLPQRDPVARRCRAAARRFSTGPRVSGVREGRAGADGRRRRGPPAGGARGLSERRSEAKSDGRAAPIHLAKSAGAARATVGTFPTGRPPASARRGQADSEAAQDRSSACRTERSAAPHSTPGSAE